MSQATATSSFIQWESRTDADWLALMVFDVTYLQNAEPSEIPPFFIIFSPPHIEKANHGHAQGRILANF